MKIDGASAHSINFIEQKKSNTSTPKKDITKDIVDTFVGKSSKKSIFLESNESLAMLQISSNSITKLQNSNKELQSLNEKFAFFKSQEDELSEKFESVTVKMLDIVDNTMFQDRGLFYVKHTISIGTQEFNLSMLDDNMIEDFTLGSGEELDNFALNLESIKKDIGEIKKQIEVANFNHMASLSESNPLSQIESNMLTKDSKVPTISVEELKQVHDINLLKDKISFLLD